MNLTRASTSIGLSGLTAAITVEQFNSYAAAVIASLTILALIPLVILRWKKFLKHEIKNEKQYD